MFDRMLNCFLFVFRIPAKEHADENKSSFTDCKSTFTGETGEYDDVLILFMGM